MLATIYLVWSLHGACPVIRHYRSQGWTVEQMKDWAREHAVPERVIRWAEKNC